MLKRLEKLGITKTNPDDLTAEEIENLPCSTSTPIPSPSRELWTVTIDLSEKLQSVKVKRG